MQAQEPCSLTDVSTDLATLVPGAVQIHREKDQGYHQHILRAIMQNRSVSSAPVLSDGTPRLLALATLKNEPAHHGLLCAKEPENGVHPSRLKDIARLLRQLANRLPRSCSKRRRCASFWPRRTRPVV
jgi:predicted ATPase